jgi:sigma-E factor negative regulatory protein RseC
LLNKIGAGKAHHLTVGRGEFEKTTISIGDQVDISVPELMVVVGAAVVYLLPLLTLMLGMVAAEAVFVTEVAAALGAVGGLFAGVFLVRLHALWLAGKPEYQPVVSAHTAVAAASDLGDVQAIQIH